MLPKSIQSFVFCLIALTLNSAHSETPSISSLDKLLKLQQLEQAHEMRLLNMSKGAIDVEMYQRFGTYMLSAEQQSILEASRNKLLERLRADAGWSAIRQIYITRLQKSLSQEEVDNIIAFIESPLGQTYREKLPMLMGFADDEARKLIMSSYSRSKEAVLPPKH